jgi:hypothetical protein
VLKYLFSGFRFTFENIYFGWLPCWVKSLPSLMECHENWEAWTRRPKSHALATKILNPLLCAMALKLMPGEVGGCWNVCSQILGLLSKTFFLLLTLLVKFLDLLNGP